jgi:hypothetical protein
MTESTEELAWVSVAGSDLPHTHAVLITTARGWHVELEDVPSGCCPLTQAECEIAFGTWDGGHYAGTVTASFSRGGAGYLLLTGVGELRLSLVADAAEGQARDASI